MRFAAGVALVLPAVSGPDEVQLAGGRTVTLARRPAARLDAGSEG